VSPASSREKAGQEDVARSGVEPSYAEVNDVNTVGEPDRVAPSGGGNAAKPTALEERPTTCSSLPEGKNRAAEIGWLYAVHIC
jgi:hypothetical protein